MLFSRLFKKKRLIKRLWKFRQSNFPLYRRGSLAADFNAKKSNEKSFKDIVDAKRPVEDVKAVKNNDIPSNVIDNCSNSKNDDEISDRPITDDELKRVFFRILEHLTVKQLKLLLHTLEDSAEDSAEFGDCVIFRNIRGSSEKSAASNFFNRFCTAASSVAQSSASATVQSSATVIAQSSATIIAQSSASGDCSKTDQTMCYYTNSPENLHKLIIKLFICDLRTLKSLASISNNDIPPLLVSALCLTNCSRRRNSPVSSVNGGESSEDSVICLNPYHYSLSHEINDHYFTSSSSIDVHSLLPSISVNLKTTMTKTNDLASEDWNARFYDSPKRPRFFAACWENKVRVGDLIEVDETVVLFYSSSPTTTGGSNGKRKTRNKRNNDILQDFSTSTNDIPNNKITYKSYDMRLMVRPKRPADIVRLRQKIGRGFYLYSTASSSSSRDHHRSDPDNNNNEIDCVWLHNRGPLTLFVQSTYLRKEAYVEHPVRLLTGYSLLVHKCRRNRPIVGNVGRPGGNHGNNDDTGYHGNSGFSGSDFPERTSAAAAASNSSVFISFSKGWGENYKRTMITCCPCWVELIFPVR